MRNAHIAILTDFSSNPFLAIRDRAADPVFAAMLIASACFGATMARLLFLFNRSSASSVSIADGFQSVQSSVDEGEMEFMDEEDAAADVPYSVASGTSLSLASPSPAENAVWLNMRFV